MQLYVQSTHTQLTKLMTAVTQLLLLSGTTQTLQLCVANPSRVELVTRRRTVLVSWIEVAKPTPLNDIRTVEHLLPQVSIYVQLGGLFPYTPPLPILQTYTNPD